MKKFKTGDLVTCKGVPYEVGSMSDDKEWVVARDLSQLSGGRHPVVALAAKDVERCGTPPKLKEGDVVRLNGGMTVVASFVRANGAVIGWKTLTEPSMSGVVAWPFYRKVREVKPGLGKFKSGDVFYGRTGRLFEALRVHEGFLCGVHSDGEPLRICRSRFPHLRRADAVQTMAFIRAKKHYDDERAEKAAVARREYNERLRREMDRKNAEAARAVKDSAAKAVNSMRDEEFAQQLRNLGHGDGADWAVKGSVMVADFFSETLKNSDHKVPVELLKQVLDGLKAFEGHRHDGNTENALCEVTRIAHRLASLVDLNGSIVEHFGGDLCLSVVYGAPLHVVSVTE